MNEKRVVDIREVDGWDLNLLVARTKGLPVVGRALCYADPDDGHMTVDMDQEVREDGFLKTEMLPVYVRNCVCDIADPEGVKLFGHDWQCLEPVPDYVNDLGELWRILTENGISVMRSFQVNGEGFDWRTNGQPKEPGPRRWSYGEKDLALAVLRQFVRDKSGANFFNIEKYFLENNNGTS